MPKIYAPVRTFSGVGAGGVVFTDGVAETDDPVALMYFRDAGYGIDGPPPGALPAFDARRFAEPILLGTPLRDAAVDPRPTDFLPPTNAGLADPHGPLVVSPGLHAVPPAPIRPGDVALDDPARQSAEETALAEAVLVNGQDVGDATAAAAAAGAEPVNAGEPPSKSANKPEWVAFAIASGMPAVDAEAATKASLIERFGGE